MSQLVMVLGLLVAVNCGAVNAADFIPAKPKVGAPAYTAEICTRMDVRRLAAMKQGQAELVVMQAKLAEVKKAVIVAPGALMPKNLRQNDLFFIGGKAKAEGIANATAKVEQRKAGLAELGQSPIFTEEFRSDLRVHDVGVLLEPIVIREILSDREAVADIFVYELASALGINRTNWFLKPVRLRVIVAVDTRGAADASKIEIKEPLRVSGTRQAAGRTLFVLEPVELEAIVEPAP
jgi:hypothetical protein